MGQLGLGIMAGAINTELIIGRLKATFRPKSELGSTKSKVRQAQQQTISNKPDQFTPQNEATPRSKLRGIGLK
jgi:hypothetical protein